MPHKDPEARAEYHKQYMREYLADPENRARVNKKANERATEIRRYIDSIKMERGCIDCGYKEHPAALDFDHIRGEKEDYKLVSSSTSIAQADREIEKCEVRCANCHRIVTWQRKWGGGE